MPPRRHARLAAASALTVLTALAGTASGTGSAAAAVAADCSAAPVQYRALDAQGKPAENWTSVGGFHGWAAAPTAVQVRLAAGRRVGEGCRYPVSLAAYRTEGSDWATSGHQTFLDSATVYLTAEDVAGSSKDSEAGQELHLKAAFGDCYGQIDLYGNDTVYDGGTGTGHGPLPYQPDGVATPYSLIAAWNGGSRACGTETSSASPSPSAPESTSPTPTPSASAPQSSAPGSPSPQPSTAPPTTASPSQPPATGTATPSTNPTVSPVPSVTLTASASPSPSSSGGPGLAETGAGDTLGLLGGGAGVILVGGAVLLLARRRNGRHNS